MDQIRSEKMTRQENLMKWARIEKGPTKRKPPVTAEDLDGIYNTIDRGDPDAVTMWRSVDLAWFLF